MRVLFIYCFLILNFNSFGQEFYFKNIGTAQGLPSSETYHSLQDSKGYIWITTDAGICRYDGTNLTTYTTKDGLPENVVFNIYEDRHGRIWFNSLSGYMFYYENGIFKNISANHELKKIASLGINCFFLGEGDTLFLALYDKYFLKIPPEKNYTFIILQKISKSHLSILANKINKNELVVGYYNSSLDNISFLDCIVNYSNKVKKTRVIYDFKIRRKKSNCTRSKMDKFQNLYINCSNTIVFIPFSDEPVKYFDSSSEILFFYPDRYNNLWVGTKDGGFFFRNSNLKSKPIRFLKELSISDIMIDRENNIWVCSLQKGLFKSFNKELLDMYSENDNVSNFYNSNNNLFIGLNSMRIIKVDKRDSILFKNTQLIPKPAILQYFVNNDGYSYYGSSEGLFYIKDKKIVLIETNQQKKNPYIVSRKIIPIGKDTFVICSTLDLYFISKQKNFKQLRPPFIVKSIIQFRNKTLLIGSRNNEGIYQYKNDSFIPYLKGYPQLKTRINDMVEDSKGNFWIATNEKGLFCYSNNKLYEFNEIKGLNSNKINELAIDNNGNVWLATNIGLNKITISAGLESAVISGFNGSHGLPNLEIEHITVFNNKVWCSTKEHLFYFDCDKMTSNAVPPFTYIKSVVINDSSRNISNSPELKYNENNISFEFTGITFKTIEKKEFLYQLQGYETDWKSSTTGQVQYTNLPYGDYTLQVYALNNDKIKSAVPATFSFRILKPFWFAWWFITIEIILVVVFIYLIIRWRVNVIRKREERKTKIGQKLAAFQMTAIRAQMNPHFLFNALSSIQHYILTNNKFNSYDYLSKFSLLIRNVLDNSQKEYILIEKEINTLSLYVELEKIRFKMPFKFLLKIDDELDQNDTYIPTMLIQPYLENAIWHGLMPKKDDCLLELELKKIDTNILVTIKDNGVGRGAPSGQKNKNHVSRAMGLTEQRLKALSIKNNSIFSVNITDLKDENGKSLGTEVKIFMTMLVD